MTMQTKEFVISEDFENEIKQIELKKQKLNKG